jgi:predicted TIM-barrel fold metal-dependent hydrolase
MIVDGHAHISDRPDGNVQVLLAQLDQAGIDRVLCIPGAQDMHQFSRILTGRLRPNQAIPNHFVFEALQRHPDRCYGLVHLNPRDGKAALDVMRQGFAHGCRGVKLAPTIHAFAFADPILEEIAAACADEAFPVYSHVTAAPGATTADYAALARRCPRTSFILGHMGFGPADADAIDQAAEIPNLYLESSLGNYLILRDALERLGPERLIFGSEFPLSHPGAELAKIRLLDASAHPAVLGGNILRLIAGRKGPA